MKQGKHVRWIKCLVFAVLLVVPAIAIAVYPTPMSVASKPNIELSTYRRCYTTGEHVSVRASSYNELAVTFSVYRFDLAPNIKTSGTLTDLGIIVNAFPVSSHQPEITWKYGLGKNYPDQWSEEDIKVPTLPPGIYLIRAAGSGAEARTWFAVTDIALVAKRSRQELLVYAADAISGHPAAALDLSITDSGGKHHAGRTDSDGVWRADVQDLNGLLWVYGSQRGHPAFITSGQPPLPDPYAVYSITDRPIYRPGQSVLFKGTVRERLESASPGGYVKRPYADKPVTVEVRDATDAVIYRRETRTNANGSIDGKLDLAAEPTLGRWQLITIIGAYRAYTAFDVQAYRKPEFTAAVKFDKTHVLGGAQIPITIDAQFLFGQPVVGATVHYSLSFARAGYGGGDDDNRGETGETPYDGRGVTDANGQLHLTVPTKRLPFNRQLTVSATVTDSSRRGQSATGDILITSGAFQLSVESAKAVYYPGDQVGATVEATDYDGKPVTANVRVQMVETKYDRAHRAYEEKTTRDIVTDTKGGGAVTFPAARPGYLTLEARAFDSDNNAISAKSYVWIAGPDMENYEYPTLSLVADRAAYRPGDTATVLLNTSLVASHGTAESHGKPRAERAWALVTIEGERLYRHMIVPVTSASTVLRVPLTEDQFPSVQVTVIIVQNKQIYEQQTRLVVQRDEQKLHVAVNSDKPAYRPGETAIFTVTTLDYLNKPVAAEVALGVVDAAIYQIAPDSTPDIETFFYGEQMVRVQTDFSFAAQYSGGAYQTIAGAPSAKQEQTADGIRVRSRFVDTAYWEAFVVTGADGTARVKFTMPDNLTTWRATAHAINARTQVGSATHDVLTTMPLLVRLELPRFYVQGDQAVVSAIVHNNTGSARSVTVTLEAEGLTVTGDKRRVIDVPAGGQTRLDWTTLLSQERKARIRIVADGGEGAKDAVQLTLPVSENGQKMVKVRSETLTAGHSSYTQPLAELPAGSSLTLRLATSVASAALDALGSLASEPYGNTEETTSAFLPDVIVAGSLRRLGVTRPIPGDLNRSVSVGLQKLYRYQHADGGWNWWEMDQSDPDMTAYVLWGLVQARDAGYLVDDQRILRGTEYVIHALEYEREPSRRADWLLSLAWARPTAAAPHLNKLYNERSKLDSYGAASLCLALSRGGASERASAQAMARDLEQTASVQGTTAHWPSEVGGYSWRDSDVTVTAHVLRALLAARPDSSLIPKAVLWLMGSRDGAGWLSTRATAEAVFALSAYMEATHELNPNFQARVLLDGKPIKNFTVDKSNVSDQPMVMTLSPKDLEGHHALTVERSGVGVLYVTSVAAYVIPAAAAKPIHQGFTVKRTYRIRVEDPAAAGTIPSGEDFDVDVDIIADAKYRYAVLEEPIPAGCEVAGDSDDDSYGGGDYVRREVRDDKVVFFFDRFASGPTHLTYRLHAETPGTYHMLPSQISLVYFPEIRGTDRIVRARIGEREDKP